MISFKRTPKDKYEAARFHQDACIWA